MDNILEGSGDSKNLIIVDRWEDFEIRGNKFRTCTSTDPSIQITNSTTFKIDNNTIQSCFGPGIVIGTDMSVAGTCSRFSLNNNVVYNPLSDKQCYILCAPARFTMIGNIGFNDVIGSKYALEIWNTNNSYNFLGGTITGNSFNMDAPGKGCATFSNLGVTVHAACGDAANANLIFTGNYTPDTVISVGGVGVADFDTSVAGLKIYSDGNVT